MAGRQSLPVGNFRFPDPHGIAAACEGSSPLARMLNECDPADVVVAKEKPVRSRLLTVLAASLALGLTAAPALAHTAMAKTSISENARLAKAPGDFTATFEHETSIAAVKLVSASGQQIQLNYKPTPAMSKTFTVQLPTLAAGKYTLSWRAIAKDGHAMPGAVHFTITG